MHTLIIANTWSSSMTCLNVLRGRGSFWGGIIIHLDCRSPDRLVRKELHYSPLVTDAVLAIRLPNIDPCDTSPLVVWRHGLSAVPFTTHRDVQSWPCMLPLLVTAHQVKTDWDIWQKIKQLSNVLCPALSATAQTETDALMDFHWRSFILIYLFYCTRIVPGKSHKGQPYKTHIINKKPC